MGVEKVCKADTARTFEFLFRFNRVWINRTSLLLDHYYNPPLATSQDLPLSHSDASISRKSCLVTKAAVYPWESWSTFLVAGCPSSYQPTRIREETLESGGPLQRKLNYHLPNSQNRWSFSTMYMCNK